MYIKSHFSFKKLIIFHFLLFVFHFINSQTLESYIEIAKQNNSDIKVKNLDYELSKEKTNEIGHYKNTDLSLGAFALTPETRVGSQLLKVGLSQELPWFGEFKAKKKLQDNLAEVKKYDIVLTEKELTYQVKRAYYELYQKKAIITILKDNKRILNTYEKMSLAALSNNKSKMSDVLKIRIQKNELHSKIFRNSNEIIALSKNFNRLLQRTVSTSLYIPDSLNVLDILVSKKTVKDHSILQKLKAKNDIYKANTKVVELDEKPKLTVGIDYILVDKYDNLTISENGKDIVMPKISLSIPIFNGEKFNSQKKQIKIHEQRIVYEIESQKNNLEMELENAILMIDNSIIEVVSAQKNKAESQRAINVDFKAYETGILDYDKILGMQLQKIKYQLMEIEATKNAFIAHSMTEYLTK